MGAVYVFSNFLDTKLQLFSKSGGARTWVSKKYGCYSTQSTQLTRALKYVILNNTPDNHIRGLVSWVLWVL